MSRAHVGVASYPGLFPQGGPGYDANEKVNNDTIVCNLEKNGHIMCHTHDHASSHTLDGTRKTLLTTSVPDVYMYNVHFI